MYTELIAVRMNASKVYLLKFLLVRFSKDEYSIVSEIYNYNVYDIKAWMAFISPQHRMETWNSLSNPEGRVAGERNAFGLIKSSTS